MDRFSGVMLGILIAVAAVFSDAVAAGPRPLRLLADQTLPASASNALDVRWTPNGKLRFTTMSGVVEVDAKSRKDTATVAFGSGKEGRCGTCSRLAHSAEFVATAFPVGQIAWSKIDAPAVVQRLAFHAIVDIDLHGHRLLIVGSRRDPAGRWAPEGAIAWIGSLRAGLADLKPVHYSSRGPDAMTVAQCGFLDPGAARFFDDGTFVIVPGVEPGVFLYDSKGKLQYTWDTAGLGIVDECDMPQEQRLLLMRDPEARYHWLSRRKIVDDVLPFRDGPALLVREVRGGVTHWRMVLLRRNAVPFQLDLPFSASSDVASLKADVRGNEIAFLIRTYGQWRKNYKATPARLILAEWQ